MYASGGFFVRGVRIPSQNSKKELETSLNKRHSAVGISIVSSCYNLIHGDQNG